MKDETHFCCANRLEKEGEQARCCECHPHKDCNLNETQDSEALTQEVMGEQYTQKTPLEGTTSTSTWVKNGGFVKTHFLGEHGAVGMLVGDKRICTECGKEIMEAVSYTASPDLTVRKLTLREEIMETIKERKFDIRVSNYDLADQILKLFSQEISAEILIAQKEGQPTSRLTSLYNKLYAKS